MTVYDNKPKRFLERLHSLDTGNPVEGICCAGFELETWRCDPFANHLVEWLPEYALIEDELHVHHGNMYTKLKQAAVRVYTSKKYEKRGEAGEISLHAICREYFNTIPISPRVFYKSAENDVIKAFDLVHARVATALDKSSSVELWLGESKLYSNSIQAIRDAIASVRLHLQQGFLTNQKLLLGPQIPKTIPCYEQIRELFDPETSIDRFLNSSIFVIGVVANSASAKVSKSIDAAYKNALALELSKLLQELKSSNLCGKLRIVLIYVPLGSKAELVKAFDQKLKGLQ